MVNTRTAFTRLLDAAASPLRDLGFRQGSTFGRRYDQGWGLVNFQSSKWSTSEVAKVAINVAISLDLLRPFQVYPPASKLSTEIDWAHLSTSVPSMRDRHWEQRLDDLMPDEERFDPVEWPRVHSGLESTEGRPLIDAIRRSAVRFLDQHVSIAEVYELLTNIEGYTTLLAQTRAMSTEPS